MFKALLIIIGIFLSVWGLCELMHRLWIAIIRPGRFASYLVTPLCDASAPEQVAAALEDLRWFGSSYAVRLIGVDMGMPEDALEKCLVIQEQTGDFVLCSAEKIKDHIG